MAAWLADQVTGSGSVLATDIDISGLSGLHRANITVARHDLEQEDAPTGEFDLIHARLVLEHLQEPPAAVGKLASALRAGGWLILEDADGLLFDAGPRKGLRGGHRAVGAGRAGRRVEPLLRRYLVTGLQQAGLDRVAGRAHRTCQPGGGAWLVARLGIDRMRDHIRREGASQADLGDALAALNDQTRVIIGAPVVTAWGQRTGRR